MKDKPIYVFPLEKWNEAECLKRSKRRRTDSYGNKGYPGIIAGSASTSPEYGQTIKYNGGTVIDDVWYSGAYRPLPVITKNFEFHKVTGWGTTIRKKAKRI